MSTTLSRCLVAAILVGTAQAQVPLSGPLSDMTTGPLVTGTVYHVSGNINVPLGATLTIQPGVVVKMPFDGTFNVNGTLLVNGTGPDSVHFTDIRDDSVGGDSNGDGGATAPAAAWWRGIEFSGTSSASNVRGLTARYGGRFIAAFELFNCAATFIDCRARNFSNDGFDLNSSSAPVLTGCGVQNCSVTAFAKVPLAALPNFSGLTASSNGENWIGVPAALVPAGQSLTIGPQNGIAGAIQLLNGLTIAAGGTLQLDAGLALKMAFDNQVVIDGQLNVAGTGAAPVHFTDQRDDTVGGDSNGDGAATIPAAGWWRGLNYQAGSGGTMRHARIRFGGRFIAGLELTSAAPTIEDTLVSNFANDGVDLNASALPVLTRVTATSCTGTAITGTPIQALPLFSSLSATLNAANWVDVTSANVMGGQSVTFGPNSGIQGVVRFNVPINVSQGGTLTLLPGTICKIRFDGSVNVDGLLLVQGTPGNRVWFTDERDDAVGGDSNADGASTIPAAGYWRGINLRATSDGSSLAYTNIRYGGRFISGLELENASVTVNRCFIADFSTVGIDCNNSADVCSFEHVVVERCQGNAIDNVQISRVVDFVNATGSGNSANRLVVRSGTVTGLVTIEPENQFLGSIALGSSLTIPVGASLNLQPGVVFKLGFDDSITVLGSFSVRGTIEEPVILTEERDDSVGGDSNGDGAATVPGPGYWRGIDFISTTSASTVLGLEVRYGGRFFANVRVQQPTVFMREVRSLYCSGDGFEFLAAGIAPTRLVAVGNGGDGVQLTSGAFDVRQITAYGNAGFGVRGAGSWTGRVLDTISRNNSSGPYTGIGAGRVRYSNGSPALAGIDGNIDVDPAFVDAVNGDFHLLAGSPCIDTGDPASPMDPDSTRADMGAYFFNVCEPTVFCPQASFPPCIPTLDYRGFASLSSPEPFWVRQFGSPTLSFAIFFYGIGAPATIPGAFGTICVGGPYQRLAPVPSGGNLADGPCVGRFEIDFNAYLRTGADPAIVVGSNVIGHFWYRYGLAPGNAAFSQAIEMPVCP